MKKFGLAMLSIFAVFVSVFFVACDKNPPSQDNKTIQEVSVNGLRDAYYVEEAIDFSAVTLTVKYEGGTTETLTKGEVDLSNTSDAQAETQFILYTDGLSTFQGSKDPGNYRISCLIIGEDKTRELKWVEVSENMSLVYDLGMFADPEFVTTYNERLANASASGSNIYAGSYDENAFMVTADYTVGNDNEFIYKPIYTVYKKNSMEIVNVNLNVSVEVKEGDVVVGSEVYTFNNETFGFTFTDQAIGHTYTITMTPTDWNLADIQLNASTFTLTVADGYNVYDEIDLGRINLLDDEHLDDIGFANYYAASVRNIFYDPVEFAGTGNYGNIKYYELWKEFLEEKNKTNLAEVNGIFIHCDLTVTESDIPSEYLISSDETSVSAAIGTIRDFAFLYNHYILSDFVINGNLFSVDFSNLKAGMSCAKKDNSPLVIYEKETDFTEAGHSAVFALIGQQGGPVAKLCNIDVRGNMSTAYTENGNGGNDNIEAIGAAGSLIFVKSIFGITEVDNIIAKEFLIGLYMEGETGIKTMDISNSKVSNCFNSGMFSFGSDNNTVTNSHFERFGGPVLFLVSRTDASSGNKVGGAGVTIDAGSKLESLVTGDEGWFSVMQATGIKSALVGTLDPGLNKYGATIQNPQGKLNLVTIVMDSDYLASQKTNIYGNFTYGNRETFDTSNANLKDKLSPTRPTFLTNDGSYLYFDYNATLKQTVLYKDGTTVLPESMGAYAGPLGMQTYDLAESGDQISLLYRHKGTTLGVVLGMYDYVAATESEQTA